VSWERTLQQRDPLAALVGRPTSFIAAIGVPLYAIALTWIGRGDIASPALAATAIGLCVLSGIVLVWQSSPMRAPLRRSTLLLVLLLSSLAHVASALSTWSHNEYLGDDWGGAAIGLYLVALAPYRPARELVLAGIATSALAGVIAVIEVRYFVIDGPAAAFLIVAMVPILALSFASAAFADVLVRSLDDWRVRARSAVMALGDERTESLARSVQQNRVTIMNREIVPFLVRLVGGEVVTEETRRRAREISDRARSVMVAEADRTWLELVADQSVRTDPVTRRVSQTAVRDESRLALHMTRHERTAVRALLAAVNNHRSFFPRSPSIEILSESGRCVVSVHVAMDFPDNALHDELAPYIAVLRVVFSDLQLDSGDADLTLRFSYEQR
jgi:hypothetical protein